MLSPLGITVLTALAGAAFLWLLLPMIKQWQERRYWLPADRNDTIPANGTQQIRAQVIRVSWRHEGDVPTDSGNWVVRQAVTWHVNVHGLLTPFRGYVCEGNDPLCTDYKPEAGDWVWVEYTSETVDGQAWWKPNRILPPAVAHASAMDIVAASAAAVAAIAVLAIVVLILEIDAQDRLALQPLLGPRY